MDIELNTCDITPEEIVPQALNAWRVRCRMPRLVQAGLTARTPCALLRFKPRAVYKVRLRSRNFGGGYGRAFCRQNGLSTHPLHLRIPGPRRGASRRDAASHPVSASPSIPPSTICIPYPHPHRAGHLHPSWLTRPSNPPSSAHPEAQAVPTQDHGIISAFGQRPPRWCGSRGATRPDDPTRRVWVFIIESRQKAGKEATSGALGFPSYGLPEAASGAEAAALRFCFHQAQEALNWAQKAVDRVAAVE